LSVIGYYLLPVYLVRVGHFDDCHTLYLRTVETPVGLRRRWLGSRPEDQPERVNQVDADLTRPVALELVRSAEHHVGKRLDGLKFLKTLAKPLGAGRSIGPVDRCLSVSQPGQPFGL